MGTQNICLIFLSPFCPILTMLPYIKNEESLFQFYLLFPCFLAFFFLKEFRKRCAGRVGWGGVISCTFISGYFPVLLVFFSQSFNSRSLQLALRREGQRQREREIQLLSCVEPHSNVTIYMFLCFSTFWILLKQEVVASKSGLSKTFLSFPKHNSKNFCQRRQICFLLTILNKMP